jgi:hypothetical protein
MKLNRKWVAAGLMMGVVITAIAMFLRGPNLSLETRRIAQCIQAEDFVCLDRYMDRHDREAYDLSPEKLAKLFKISANYFTVTQQPVKVMDQSDVGQCIGLLPLKSSTGRSTEIAYIVRNTDEGVRAPQFITSVLFSMSATRESINFNAQMARERVSEWEAFAESEGPKLAAEGFPGVLRDPAQGLLNWEEWRVKAASLAKRRQ